MSFTLSVDAIVLQSDWRTDVRFVIVPGQSLVIGRIADDGADLVLPHPTVNARHARIIGDEGGRWTIRDLGSTPGSFVNEVGLGFGGEARFSPGDVLRLGGAALVVSVAAEGEPPTAPLDRAAGVIVGDHVTWSVPEASLFDSMLDRLAELLPPEHPALALLREARRGGAADLRRLGAPARRQLHDALDLGYQAAARLGGTTRLQDESQLLAALLRETDAARQRPARVAPTDGGRRDQG